MNIKSVFHIRLRTFLLELAATLILVLTNRWHHLVWTAFTPERADVRNLLLFHHGVWYSVWTFYAAMATASAAALLIEAMLNGMRFFARQASLFLAGALFPWIGAALYLAPHNLLPGFDFPSMGFAATGMLILLGIYRFGLLDVVPMARAALSPVAAMSASGSEATVSAPCRSPSFRGSTAA